IRFNCGNCGHKLNASPDLVGRRCKCSRCGRKMTVPATSQRLPQDNNRAASTDNPAGLHLPPPLPASAVQASRGPVSRKVKLGLIVGASIVAVLVLVCVVVFLTSVQDVDRKLSDLKTGDSSSRQEALVWLADADVDPAHQGPVTSALEPVVFEGDVRGDL